METLRNILIVGKGGREHALGDKLAGSPHVEHVYFAPGNAGTARVGRNLDIDSNDYPRLVQFAADHNAFTVVGPEDPIVNGIYDCFAKDKLPIFAPSGEAAVLESSKAWAVEFMKRHDIPHPDSKIFTSADAAFSFVKNSPWKAMVVKASGLTSGKGVFLPRTQRETIQAVYDLLTLGKCGSAGDTIVIQKKVAGQEMSIFALCDGNSFLPILPVYDYKRALDYDRGLNTGGMGSCALAPSLVDPRMIDMIYKKILAPTVKGMKEEGRPFIGMLYAGLMLTKRGPKVLEYNVRFGDPETQALMRLLKSDLAPLLLSCVRGTLFSERVEFAKGASVCVVLCSKGYPQAYRKGVIVEGLDKIKDPAVKVFHAGTVIKNRHVLTDGGRVLGVTAIGQNISDAVSRVYGVIDNPVRFSGMHYRTDIGASFIS